MGKKEHAKSLSGSKLVYARDEDPSNTIVVRNLYPNLDEQMCVFGMKGKNHIKNVLLAILVVLRNDLKKLKRKVKYVYKDDFEDLQAAFNEMGESMAELRVEECQDNVDYNVIRFQAGEGYIRLMLSIKAEHPHLIICNENKEKKFINGMNLFISETIKLLRYLNSRFSFTEEEILKLSNTMDVKAFVTDKFF